MFSFTLVPRVSSRARNPILGCHGVCFPGRSQSDDRGRTERLARLESSEHQTTAGTVLRGHMQGRHDGRPHEFRGGGRLVGRQPRGSFSRLLSSLCHVPKQTKNVNIWLVTHATHDNEDSVCMAPGQYQSVVEKIENAKRERDTQSAWTTSAPGTMENTLVDSATRRTVTMQRVRRIQTSSTSTSGTGQHGFDWVHPVIGSLMVDAKSSRWWWWSLRQRQMGDHARGDDRRSRIHYGRRLLIRLELLSNSRSNIIRDWAAAHCIQWDLSPVGSQQRTGQATISLVKTAATKMASCDAAFSIPDLFTWASAVHSTPSRDAINLCRACHFTAGQFLGNAARYD